jgi:hypothetical protein
MGMNLEIHIEELVLHGFDPRDKKGIGEAMERELARLFMEQGVPGAIQPERNLDRIDAGSFVVGRGSVSKAVGAGVARSVYGGLRK